MIDCVYAKDSVGAERRICELIGPHSIENARLIAAAPDMLESLKQAEQAILAAIPHASAIRDILFPRLESIRSVIAKATETT